MHWPAPCHRLFDLQGLTDSCPGCLQWGHESFPGATCPSRGHRNYYGTRAEPWVPKHVLRKCQNKNPPLAAKTMRPPGSKAQEHRGGDAGLGTSHPRTDSFPTEHVAWKKRFPTQDAALKVNLGREPSQTLSRKGQLPPESLSQEGSASFGKKAF